MSESRKSEISGFFQDITSAFIHSKCWNIVAIHLQSKIPFHYTVSLHHNAQWKPQQLCGDTPCSWCRGRLQLYLKNKPSVTSEDLLKQAALVSVNLSRIWTNQVEMERNTKFKSSQHLNQIFIRTQTIFELGCKHVIIITRSSMTVTQRWNKLQGKPDSASTRCHLV